MALQIGDFAPDFTLPATGGVEVSLKQYRGQPVVLYFYPRDATPGCTQEACDFRDAQAVYAAHNAVILGVSTDSLKRHDNFAAKQELNFPLLSDPESDVCRTYGVWVEKKLYGKTHWGIERSTFLIDRAGKIARIWRKVKVKGHVDEVLAALAEL